MENPHFIANAIQFISSTVTKNSITLQPKQPWQPSVVALSKFVQEWVACFNHNFTVFYRDHECKTFDPQFAISMSKMTVREYLKDVRYDRQLFPRIPGDLLDSVELLVYFPPEYTLNALEMDIKDYSMLQDDKLAKTINTIGQGLGSFLHRNFPDYYFEILPIGSRSYGAYSTSTDFNFCVIMDDPDLDWIAQNEDSIRHSQFLQPAESDHIALLLSKDPSFKKGSYDDSFNTLRYHDPIGHVEFVFNKKVYTESTELIMHYIGLDDRVGQLISVVRNFVQLRNVTKGGLHGAGFYQYCIMVLAYLQQLDPPIIPNLQHLGFGNTDCCRVPNCRTNRKYWDVALSHKVYVGGAPYYHTCVTKDITMPETRNYVQQDGKGGYYWNSSNNAKISELLLGFFYYYGYEFNFKRNGVSLKNGGVVAKNNNTVYFYIEDPFLTGVNVADPNKIARGISFFLGAFIIMYNEELSFSETLRYGGLLKIPEIKRLRTTKVPYQPLTRQFLPPATAISFLLIGLSRTDDHKCQCDVITAHYKYLGCILHIEVLDSTTKRIYLELRNSFNGRELALPTPIKLNKKIVHVAKLYGFTVRN